MINYIKLMRPKQYLKNVFIFLPLFFGLQLTNIDSLISVFLGFIFFSLTASSIYILNDYKDIELDRLHPTKKNRPLASGIVSKRVSLFLAIGLFLFSSIGLYLLSIKALAIMFLYVFINIFYIFLIKNIAILDIISISIGFVLRLFIGAFIANIELSMWIVIMTFLLSLFLILAKRRDDVLIFMETGVKTRKVIEGYSLKFIDTLMSIMAAVIMIGYILYTISADVINRIHSDNLYLTSIFVLVGIMRYLQISFVYQESGSPTNIIAQDRFIQIIVLGWVLSFLVILY